VDVPAAEILPPLAEVMQGKDLYDAVEAADLAAKLGQDAKTIEPVLLRGIQGDQFATVIKDLDQKNRPDDIAYLPVLLLGAKSSAPAVEARSLFLLGNPVYASASVSNLIRGAVKPTVGGVTDVTADAIEALVRGLHDDDRYARERAAESLDWLGSKPNPPSRPSSTPTTREKRSFSPREATPLATTRSTNSRSCRRLAILARWSTTGRRCGGGARSEVAGSRAVPDLPTRHADRPQPRLQEMGPSRDGRIVRPEAERMAALREDVQLRGDAGLLERRVVDERVLDRIDGIVLRL
jgi:hypothetical protein